MLQNSKRAQFSMDLVELYFYAKNKLFIVRLPSFSCFIDHMVLKELLLLLQFSDTYTLHNAFPFQY